MKRTPLKIGNLTASLPLIQGGMGIGISLGGLAGAVAREGAVGIISAAQIGFREPDFAQNPLAANLRAMKTEFEKAKAMAPKGIIGFNIMVAMKHYEEYVRQAVKIGADLIISGAGIPSDLPRLTAGSDTKLVPIVSTNKAAKVILRYWEKKYNRLPDMVVVEGPEAGGHLGFSLEELQQYGHSPKETGKDLSRSECASTESVSQTENNCQTQCTESRESPLNYEAECQGILQTVAEYGTRHGKHIPAAAAGGIDTPEAASRMFALGFDAVQVASRFVTTEECDADIYYKESYLRANKADIALVKSPVGMPGRAIYNKFMEQVAAGKKFPPTHCYQCLRSCNPTEIPYCITEALVHAATGDVENALLFCGANAYKQKKIETVKEVIENLLQECV